MNSRLLIVLALREIRNHPRFALIFILNAALGLLGLMGVEHFKHSFNSVLEQRSKTLLGADMGIRARQGLPESELDKVLPLLPEDVLSHRLVSLFSMTKAEEESRLVSIRGIPSSWPYYGGLRLRDLGNYPDNDSYESYLEPNHIWIYSELSLQLGVEIGEKLSLGGRDFIVSDIVEEDSQQTFDQGGLAPRVFMRIDDLEEIGLVDMGSRYSERLYFKWPTGTDPSEIKDLAAKWEELISDPAVSVLTPEKSSQQVGRTLNYLNDFLSLVSLVALFMACVGIFYLHRSYLNRRREDMATLCCLGLSRVHIFKLYLIHLLLLGFFGTTLAFISSLVIFPLVSFGLSQLLPFELAAYSGLRPFILGGSVGIFSQILLAYPLLRPILYVNPQAIFQSLEDGPQKEGPLFWVLCFIPWLFFYWVLAVYSSNSFVLGSSFVGIFIGVAIIVYPLGSLLLSWIEKKELNLSLKWKLALKTLTRFRFSTLSLFISLVLGSLLLNLIPQIERNLQDEIDAPADERRLPGLFMFDIQEEQVSDLKNFMKESELELRGLSPLVRARLTHINDEEFSKGNEEALTREEEQAQRIRNRGINLTYRAQLDESETIIEGESFSSEDYEWGSDKKAEVSVEHRYADRLGIELGDELEFDILDMPVEAKVVSIRKIRWTSFMPNFFIVFQPGVLEDAPKTYLAVTPALGTDKKVWLQNELTSRFSNISLIDVALVIEKIMQLLKQMSWALQVMALLSIGVGLFVLYSLIQHQMGQRKKDLSLLKALGLNFKDLNRMVLIEFFLLSGLAGFIGGSASMLVTYIFSVLFFDGVWSFDLWTPTFFWFCLTSLCLLVSHLAARKTLRVKAQELLQEAL